jgi:hypothetical protein
MCWNVSFQARDLTQYALSPALERLAIEHLSSGVVGIKNGFAELLGQYDSAAARQPFMGHHGLFPLVVEEPRGGIEATDQSGGPAISIRRAGNSSAPC